ncbi:MAG: flagellar export chaperone FliS [Bacillota bacterium]
MAALRDPYQSYRQIQVETADQHTLLIMLYNGALRFLSQGREALEDNNFEKANRLLGRGQDILCELMGSLNPVVPEMSGRLFNIYEYMHYRLAQAIMQKEPALVNEVEQLLVSLLEAWQAISRHDMAAGNV